MADPLPSQNYQQHQPQQVGYTQGPPLPGGQRMPSPLGGQLQPNGSPLNASPIPGQQPHQPLPPAAMSMPQQLPPAAMSMPQQFKNQPPGMNPPPGTIPPPANGFTSSPPVSIRPNPSQPFPNTVPQPPPSSQPGPSQPFPNTMPEPPPSSQLGPSQPFPNTMPQPPPSSQPGSYPPPPFAGERPPGPSQPPVSAGPAGGQLFRPQNTNPVMNGPSNFPAPSSVANQPTEQFTTNLPVNRFSNPPQARMPSPTGVMDGQQGGGMAPRMVQPFQQGAMPPSVGAGQTQHPPRMPQQRMVQPFQQGGTPPVPNPPQAGMSPMGMNSSPRMPQSQQDGGMSHPGMVQPFQQGGTQPIPKMTPPQSGIPPHQAGIPPRQAGIPPTMGASSGPPQQHGPSFQPPRAGFPQSTLSGPPPQVSSSPVVPGGAPPRPGMPATNVVPPVQGQSRPNELPVPYHGHGQYSHQVGASMKLTPGLTPNSSDPSSQKSSRAPSPVSVQSIDALEGQFTLSSQGAALQPPCPGFPQQAAAPTQQDANQKSTGITGRRQYPQMGAFSPSSASGSSGGQPGMYGSQPGTGYNPNTATAYNPQIASPSYNTNSPTGYNPQAATGYSPQTATGYNPQTATGYNPQTATGYNPQTETGYTPQTATSQGLNQPTKPAQTYGGAPGPLSGPTGQRNFNLSQPNQPATQQQKGLQNSMNAMSGDFAKFGVSDSERMVNLMQEKRLIPPDGLELVKPSLQHDFKHVNCNPEIFRCTLRCIPQTSSLLNKSRLPLGILIHPFKDLSDQSEDCQLPVIQSSVIVRCRSCRTYINPFVHFLDQRRWKCNLCYRVNELPEEFTFDPVSKTYGDPQRRPEVRSSTIEFIAPSEYMLRPPQPAVYLFLLDVSFNAVETGYLSLFCQTLIDELDKLPGDSRTQIGFLAFDRFLYFFNLAEGIAQPQMMIVPDLEDIFLPCPDNLLVNLHESKDLVIDLLSQLPGLFESNSETGSALGAALQAAYKLMSSTGGRVTVMQTVLPTVGPGALQTREMPSQDVGKHIPHLGPATDFYKKMALDFSAQQIAVDLFMLNGQYADLATLSCISKYSAGCIQYYPSFHTLKNVSLADKFDMDLRRYLTRKIGFEAVMRIRCTRGLSIHTFHGNFFVRSTDLLSLPNINPDAGFGMQMSVEDALTDVTTVCFQAALLYTSSKGERRIRVHTLCLPVTNQISDVFGGADQEAIVSLLAKMAVDRSVSSSVGDAKDALINAALDAAVAFGGQVASTQRMGALPYPYTLRCMPLFVLALIKSIAFRLTSSIKLDDRVFLLQQFKTLPSNYLLQAVYPFLYPVHNLEDEKMETKNDVVIPKPPQLQLNSANIDRHGVYVMNSGDQMLMLVGGAVSDHFCQQVLDKPNFMSIPDDMTDLPELENPTSDNVRNFVNYLIDSAPSGPTFHIIREDSKMRNLFFQNMIEDRTDSSMSYFEFLQYLQQRTKS